MLDSKAAMKPQSRQEEAQAEQNVTRHTGGFDPYTRRGRFEGGPSAAAQLNFQASASTLEQSFMMSSGVTPNVNKMRSTIFATTGIVKVLPNMPRNWASETELGRRSRPQGIPWSFCISTTFIFLCFAKT